MKDALVINFIGGPGAGKSTLAAHVFAYLKEHQVSCELATEFAKELIYDQRDNVFQDETYIYAKQEHRLFRLKDKVDVIVTDHPLILKLYWNKQSAHYLPELSALALAQFNSYNNLNFFVSRAVKYETEGRNETEEQSNRIEKEIKQILIANNIEFIETNANDINNILNIIKERIDLND